MTKRAVQRWMDRPEIPFERGDFGSEERTAPYDGGRWNGRCLFSDGPAVAALLNEGDYWTLIYSGVASRLKDVRGLHYLAHLLRHPGQEFHVLDLAWQRPVVLRGESELRGAWSSEVRHPILDDRAKGAYRRRLEELRDELAEAERFNDSGREEQARGEVAALTRQLAAAVGLGGRDRAARTAAERARSAVTQRLRGAIQRIARQQSGLADHLSARVRTGTFCVYRPDPERPIVWGIRSLCCTAPIVGPQGRELIVDAGAQPRIVAAHPRPDDVRGRPTGPCNVQSSG
jgi:hypothetical protein